MTKEEFRFLIDSKKEWEFTYKNLVYTMTYGKDSRGEYIALGRLYEPVRYYSYGELMNEARIENSYFREVLQDLRSWKTFNLSESAFCKYFEQL